MNAALVALSLLLTAASPSPDPCVERMMATEIRVVLPGVKAPSAVCDAVFAEFAGVEARMNEWKPSSPLGKVNQAAGGAGVAVPEELFELVRRGKAIGELTGGAFDITWAALWGLWDFRAAQPKPPEAAVVRERVDLVDYRQVGLDAGSHRVSLPREKMAIGLGGIAKGYALELARGVLSKRGVRDFTVSAGGQVLVGGKKSGRLWRVGIRDPRGPAHDYFAVLEVSDTSVSTSGDYERYFEHEGVRYHHILDPRTGQPARGLRSATVVSADPTLADALSTACMVLGRERALELVGRLEGIDAVLVDHDAKVWVTAGLQQRIKTVHRPKR